MLRRCLQNAINQALDTLGQNYRDSAPQTEEFTPGFGNRQLPISCDLVIKVHLADGSTIEHSEEILLSVGFPKSIEALFQWRDQRTDRYGDDLAALLLYDFGSDPDYNHSTQDVPEEFQEGLRLFQSLSHDEQDRLCEEYAARP